ncbi:MAG TPA: hypothetical protein VE399_07825, partial [Gemmatimonadales bacterium]|nr:hypothetical protein [Gemmatimonadales bacterium]
MSDVRRGSGEAGKRGSSGRKLSLSVEDLQPDIERYATGVPSGDEDKALAAFQALKSALNAGTVRAAERGPDGQWRVNSWVKAGILLGFRLGRIRPAATGGPFPFYDKDTYPLRRFGLEAGVRIVPGGSSIRDGCYVAPGVVCMPPMYINVGAYVGEGSMIDSHALVGSCAQIGR